MQNGLKRKGKWKQTMEKQQITGVPRCFKTIRVRLTTRRFLATQVNRKITFRILWP